MTARNQTISASPTPRRPQGRPRRLTIDTIIDTACEIGIDRLDMAGLAAKLGTGVATLYGYVDNYDHLVHLTLQRLARSTLIVDHGQSWQAVLREHAAAIFAVYRRHPQLIGHMMDGTRRTLADIVYFDHVVKLLVDRGIAAPRALSLYFEVNQIVVGAAVGMHYRASAEAAAGGPDALRQELIAACDASGLPALGEGFATAGLPPALGDYERALERLIAEYDATP
ncbi:TetR/AcrR family transcriptional regulator C-terminal domain-containing protein [Sphingomonas montanisoli]|nr:TetR/AcrR family transcriptional regulator C-terminal domain-containing protein [Sphingomonas montanisoli]